MTANPGPSNPQASFNLMMTHSSSFRKGLRATTYDESDSVSKNESSSFVHLLSPKTVNSSENLNTPLSKNFRLLNQSRSSASLIQQPNRYTSPSKTEMDFFQSFTSLIPPSHKSRRKPSEEFLPYGSEKKASCTTKRCSRSQEPIKAGYQI